MTQDATGPQLIRIYLEARTAHLERLRSMLPGTFLYVRSRYDFDPHLAESVGARRVTRWKAIASVLRSKPQRIEVNEPAYLVGIPFLVALHAAVRIRWMFLRQPPPRFGFYAIENADFAKTLASKLRIPRALAALMLRIAFRIVIPRGTRVAFGTPQARRQYEDTVSSALRAAETADVFALPVPCPTCLQIDDRGMQVTYLGSFEERKGILDLLAAWPIVSGANSSATLKILGKGELLESVAEAVSRLENAQLIVDPSRATIHKILSETRTLVLPSRRTSTWREQVGLPIVEGLAHGCQIVCSTETGLAPWLEATGHGVVEPGDVSSIAIAIETTLFAGRMPSAVLNDLPDSDGRLDADLWINR